MPASQGAEIDAIVFDLDGTVWDTCETCAIGWNLVLDRNAIRFRTITADDVRAIAGKPHEQCTRETFVGVPEPQILTLIAETQLEDNELVAEQGGVLYADVEDGIRQLPGLIHRDVPRVVDARAELPRLRMLGQHRPHQGREPLPADCAQRPPPGGARRRHAR